MTRRTYAGVTREQGETISRYWSDEKERSRNKHMLLVEGDDDRTILEVLLGKRGRAWSTRVSVVAAGGRNQVLRRLEEVEDAFGLVARDTWTDAEATDVCTKFSDRLFVTDGWCVENDLIDVDDAGIAGLLNSWSASGAFWWTVQRHRDARSRWFEPIWGSFGAPDERLDLTDAATRRASLAAVAPAPTALDVDDIVLLWEERLREIAAWPPEDRWRKAVYGKAFFNCIVAPQLQRTAPTENDLRKVAARGLPRLPPTIETLIAILLP